MDNVRYDESLPATQSPPTLAKLAKMAPWATLIMGLLGIFWLACGITAAVLGSGRGENALVWLIIGVLLGPFGIVLCLATAGTPCPKCRSRISATADRCPKCQADLATPPAPDTENEATLRLVAAFQANRPVAPASAQRMKMKKCPDCAESIRAEASKCRYCGYRFSIASDQTTP